MTHPRISMRVCTSDTEIHDALCADVRVGLSASPKFIPPKWFYDKRGSELFDAITRLPEYYPTNAERAIFATYAREIVGTSGCDTLAELGSGSSDKTQLLLAALIDEHGPTSYLPLDVSADALEGAALRLVETFPGLSVDAVVGDFDRHLDEIPKTGRRMVTFLGGTIGNYAPLDRHRLLGKIAAILRDGETLLLGTDLIKEESRLVRAYDDSAGVTAAFNCNVLQVVNSRLGANFDTSNFVHVARWNAEQAWIEMWLRAVAPQRVLVRDLDLDLMIEAGESILTEISAKFNRDTVMSEMSAVGLRECGWWEDGPGDFAVSLWRKC